MGNQDRICEVYKGETGSDTAQRRARDRINWLCGQAQGLTLDLGCSQGIAAILLARSGIRVVGLDVEFDRLEYAEADRRTEATAVGRRLAFLCASGTHLPFPDATFGTVLLGEVLEHLLRPEEVLAEVIRVVRRSGRVVLTVPFGYHPHHDHKQTFYVASVLQLLAPFLTVVDMDIVDSHIRIVAQPGPCTDDDLRQRVFTHQRVLEQLIRDREADLVDACRTARHLRDQLRETTESVRNEAEARSEKLRAEIDTLKHEAVHAQWRVQAMEARRWWRLGAALYKVWKRPAAVVRLPVELARIALRPSPRPPEPRRIGPGAKGMDGTAVSVPAVALPSGPVVRPELRVATLLDCFSALCFRYEFDCVAFGPDDWREQFEREPPQLLLVESAWRGNDGRWSYAMTSDRAAHSELEEVVRWCRHRRIPTVFWNKEDPANYDVFVRTAKLFDVVFTTDEDCVPRYHADLGHDRVALLPFAAQPRIHNPIAVCGGRSYNVAFAGTYFAEKHVLRRGQMETILDPARAFDLHIFSRMGNDDPRYRFPDKYGPHIVGSVPYEMMVSLYKRYKVFLNVNSVVDSASMCARRIFELAACGTPVLSRPSPAIERFFGSAVATSSEPEQTRVLLAGLLRNKELRDRQALQAMRVVQSAHTFTHRVDEILQTVGLAAPRKTPPVSVVVTTTEPGQIDHVVANVVRQCYRPLELVLVLHGLDLDAADVERTAKEAGIEQVVVLDAERESTLGRCLNLGTDAASGAYLANMDANNFYGEQYLSDLMFAFSYTDAGVVGKRAHYVYFSARNVTLLCFASHEHRYGDLVQGGTMLIERSVAEQIRFDNVPQGADTDFLQRCNVADIRVYAADRFNFVSIRNDHSAHRWTIADEELLVDSTVQFYAPPFDHVSV